MALAQPTGLTVQALEPFATLEQAVRREHTARTIATLEQWTGGQRPARTIATLEQLTGYLRQTPAGTLATLEQHTGHLRINDAATAATLEQAVVFERVNDAAIIAALEQTVSRTTAARRVARLRQTVQDTASAPAQSALVAARHTLVFLDDEEITGRCSLAYDVTASEGDNRTATVTYYPPSGPISITSYQGRDLEIHRRIDDTWQPIFVGKVDVPTYHRDRRAMQLRCSDLRGERLGREDKDMLQALTGGLYSTITQREEATGEQWVRELMKTVEGSLDYNGAGALQYRPWKVATPRYTLEPGDIHHREISMEFATRSEIVNRVSIRVGFRWYRRHTFEAGAAAYVGRTSYCNGDTCLPDPDQQLPTKEAAISAAQGISNWEVISVSTGSPPPSGWYRNTSSAFVERVAYGSTDSFRDTYATGVSVGLVRYISQGMRWTDEITIEAPQSIDQFEAIDGSAMSFSIDTRIDPGVFEETGCYTRPEQDRLVDREVAIRSAQAMAVKQIRGSHRNNYAQFRYKPKTGRPGARQILPAEIGDTISVTTDEVTVTGWVSEITHSNTGNGDAYSDIKLAVSRVDSAVSVTEDVAVPPVGTPNRINAESQKNDEPICGPDTMSDQDAPTSSGIALDGSITLVAPAIPADKTDELVGEGSSTYSIAIPVNPFEVEVP